MAVTPLIQASQAYPAMERMVLGAKKSVWLAFRIFDPETKLRSPQAKAEGLESWADLARRSCKHGIEWHVRLTDFDAIGATDLHGLSHRSVQGFRKASNTNMQAVAILHPHELGWLPRAAFWWPARQRLRHKLADLRLEGLSDADIAYRFPGLRSWVESDHATLDHRWRWPPFAIHPIVHHEKLMIVDRDRMILGGLDVNERRYDDHAHERPADQTWHDVSLQIEDESRPVQQGCAHFVALWNNTVSRQADSHPPLSIRALEPPTAQDHQTGADTEARLSFVRTLSQPNRAAAAIGPRELVHEIESAHLDMIANAEDLIYLETQYLRSRSVADALCTQAERRPDLHLIVLLPAAPDDVAFENNTGPDAKHGSWLQARAIDQIKRAFGERALFVSLVGAKPPKGDPDDITDHARVNRQPIIYVHSKVTIVDGREAIVASANLNGRSMRWDTESGVVWRDAEGVTAFQADLWAKHFKTKEAPRFEGPNRTERAFAAFQQAAAPHADTFLVLYPHHRAKRFAASKLYVPNNMV